MKILVVHNCESLAEGRRSTLDYIHSFERYAPEHQYVYHRIMLPPTATLMSTAWDAVIFDSTSLGIVSIRPREKFQRIRDRWAFLRHSSAVKLVFPQDDASHSAVLDLWFNWMNVSAVFSVRPEKKEQLYPITTERAEFISTVSGFVDDATVSKLASFRKPLNERTYLFGQRATMYPAWGGRFAQRKGFAAARIAEECQRRGLPANISTNPKDVFLGDDWYRFLGDCRFVVGAEGGHGIWDPYGAIQDGVNHYVARFPGASFEEIESFCFLGLDGRDVFPGFAPRVLEAAMLGCGQVLVEGHYRGFVIPGVHYIPLKPDFSNLDEVFAAVENTDRVRDIIAASDRDLIQSSRFRYSTMVREVFDFIKSRSNVVKQGSVEATSTLRMRHFKELELALYGLGITEERLHEPYLTDWVRRELGGQVTDHDMRSALGIDVAPEANEAVTVPEVHKTPAEKVAEVLVAMGYGLANLEEIAIALSQQKPDCSDKLLIDVLGLLREGHGNILRQMLAILAKRESAEGKVDAGAKLSRFNRAVQVPRMRGQLMRILKKMQR